MHFLVDVCDIDGHYIDAADCFEEWCRRWKKERPKDGKND
jgi:hypothetical protein